MRLLLAFACASVAACSAYPPLPDPRPVTSADSTRAKALAREQQQGGTLRGAIGVPPFASGGSDSTLTPLSYALADLISTDLSFSRQVRIVERARFGEVLRELDLATSGRVDSATAPRVGRLVSAERLIFGSLETMPDGKTLRLGARIGRVADASVTSVIDAQAPLAEIFAAEKALVLRLFESLGIVLTPAERARVDAQPTRNLSALLAYGRGMERYYAGDFRGASSAFRDAQRLDPTFRLAGARDVQIRSIGAIGTGTPIAIPGVRPLDGAISSTIDRLNRPLDVITNVSRTVGSALDASFPGAQATILITITRP